MAKSRREGYNQPSLDEKPMKKITLTLSLLVLTAGFAAARGRGGRSGDGFSGSNHFARLARPTFSPSPSSRSHASNARSSSAGVASHSGFASGASSAKGVNGFTGRSIGAKAATTGTPGGGTSGGGTGGGSTGGTGGTAAPTTEVGGWATPGSKILTAGQQPVYSTPAGGGTASVNGGGFIAINQGQAGDVGRSPGVTWAKPDQPQSSGAGISGSGATSNGPAFNPAF